MPAYDRYAGNPYQALVQPLDYSAQYAPTAQAYHGFSLSNGNEDVIGRITSFNPSQNYQRNHALIYELSAKTFGVPVDMMPGVSTGYQLSMVRVELWGQEIETVLDGGGTPYNVLNDQVRPVKLNEYLYRGDTLYLQWEYLGCWWVAKNQDNYTADGDGIIRVNCDLAFVRRNLVGGSRRAA